MTRGSMAITEENYHKYGEALAAYAESHPGCTYRAEHFDVAGPDGKLIIFPLYSGSHRCLIVYADDFTLDCIEQETGVMSFRCKDKDRLLSVLRNRSGVDFTVLEKGRIYLHEGCIEVQPFREKDEVAILWYGDAEVTKHVAALLGLLKDLT